VEEKEYPEPESFVETPEGPWPGLTASVGVVTASEKVFELARLLVSPP